MFYLFTYVVWLMLSVYIANMSPAIFAHFYTKTTPIDFGKSLGKNRILGDGKTYEGFLVGFIIGFLVINIQNYIANSINMPTFPMIITVVLPIGCLLGDMIASFLKRRLSIKRGSSLPLVDQLDFVFGAWIFAIIFDYLWFKEHFTLSVIMFTLVLTASFHWVFNIIGYKLGVSREPW